MNNTDCPPASDTPWADAFANDTIRESVQSFDDKTHGFSEKQREWSAQFYFHGVAEGARLARDTDLQRLVANWIANMLRPHGYERAARKVGVKAMSDNNLDEEMALQKARREAQRMSADRPIEVGVYRMWSSGEIMAREGSRHYVPGTRIELYARGGRVD